MKIKTKKGLVKAKKFSLYGGKLKTLPNDLYQELNTNFYTLINQGLNVEEIAVNLGIDLQDSVKLCVDFGFNVDTGDRPLSNEYDVKVLQSLLRQRIAEYSAGLPIDKMDMAFILKIMELMSKK